MKWYWRVIVLIRQPYGILESKERWTSIPPKRSINHVVSYKSLVFLLKDYNLIIWPTFRDLPENSVKYHESYGYLYIFHLEYYPFTCFNLTFRANYNYKLPINRPTPSVNHNEVRRLEVR